MKTIFRVENKEGTGPWYACHEDSDLDVLLEGANVPTPTEDKMDIFLSLESLKDAFFAFEDMNILRRFFDKRLLRALKRSGFKLVQYEVPEFLDRGLSGQVVFSRSKARRVRRCSLALVME